MDKAAKAEARIKAACQSLGITDGGRLWLDVALDPFKDIVQKPIGYPDRNMAPSVVQTVHDSIDISAPVGTVGNWDANIFLDSLWKSTPLCLTGLTTPQSLACFNGVGQAASGFNRGGLVVRAAASGTPLDITTTQNNKSLPYVTDVFANQTSSRMIGVGLEIHNTTSELHKQGSLITYRVADDPCQYPIKAVPNAATVVNSLVYTGVEVVEPPISAAQAIDLPGSLQWEAAKGAYIVPVFIQEENNAQDLRELIPIEVDATTVNAYVPKIVTTGSLTAIDSTVSQNATVPISLSGAFLTGLSLETTLTVNLTYYVEQFPSVTSQLRRVAGPSCVEDFAAIELYTKVSRQLPTGVEVNDNFLGAFVSGVSRFIQAAVPHIPKILNVVGGIAGALNPLPNREERMNEIVTMPRKERVIETRVEEISSRPLVRQNQLLPLPQRQVQIQQRPTKTITTTTITGQNRTPRSQTVKNKRDKDFDRLDKYIKAGQSGNRYINMSGK